VAAGALALGIGGLSACADAEAAKQVSDAVDVVDVTTDVTLAAGETAPPDQGIVQQSNAAVCDVERKTLEIALEAYYAMNGSYPVAESDLVTSGLLREESVGLDIAPDGVIVPAAGAGCA
jgi:inosine-uridine nucleoside N-ribohydrolase